jgi:hypothetical protein
MTVGHSILSAHSGFRCEVISHLATTSGISMCFDISLAISATSSIQTRAGGLPLLLEDDRAGLVPVVVPVMLIRH